MNEDREGSRCRPFRVCISGCKSEGGVKHQNGCLYYQTVLSYILLAFFVYILRNAALRQTGFDNDEGLRGTRLAGVILGRKLRG